MLQRSSYSQLEYAAGDSTAAVVVVDIAIAADTVNADDAVAVVAAEVGIAGADVESFYNAGSTHEPSPSSFAHRLAVAAAANYQQWV